ncbi:MAG: hypothetical protein HWE20_00310 [Gammaproteobacteria bacterium]|nr:hypothetical protein [Gammaproteobacteria bacterium]
MAKKTKEKTETSPARIIVGLILGLFVVLFAVNWAVNHQPASKERPAAKPQPTVTPTMSTASLQSNTQTQRSTANTANTAKQSVPAGAGDAPLMLAVDTSVVVSSVKSAQASGSSTSVPAAKPDPVLSHYIDQGLSIEQLNRRIEGAEDIAPSAEGVAALTFSTAKMTERITFNFTTSSRRIYARLPLEKTSHPHVLVEVVSGFNRQVAMMSLSAADQARVVSLHQLPKTLGVGSHRVRVFALTADAPLIAEGELVIER